MRAGALLYLYRRRLRVHAVQELLAGLGVAIAVALVFATVLVSGSIAGSAAEVVHAVVGPATLQLRASGADGFDEASARARRTPPGRQAGRAAAGADRDDRRAERPARDGRPRRHRHQPRVLDGLAHTLPIATLSAGRARAQPRERASDRGRPPTPPPPPTGAPASPARSRCSCAGGPCRCGSPPCSAPKPPARSRGRSSR